jgi:hypothetical protein
MTTTITPEHTEPPMTATTTDPILMDIRLDATDILALDAVQQRDGIDLDKVREYAELYRDGRDLGCLVLFAEEDDGAFAFYLADGFHQKRREAPSFTAGMDRRWARRAQCPRAQQYPRSARALNGEGTAWVEAPAFMPGRTSTRIPATLKVASQVIGQALQWDIWQTFDDNTRYQPLALCHYGMAQRWLVVYAQAACERAEATLKNATQREDEAIKKQLFHLQAQRFCTPTAAQDALSALAKRWKYHAIASYHLTEHKRSAGQGRPTPRTPLKAIAWQIQGHVHADDTTIEQAKQVQACYVLGTNIDPGALCNTEVLTAYKGQAHVEGGFRFLKDPLFFVSSLFVKKPNRLTFPLCRFD